MVPGRDAGEGGEARGGRFSAPVEAQDTVPANLWYNLVEK